MKTAQTHFTLGHSPDPDDAFMFYALAKDKMETGGWTFEHILSDIETLNQRARGDRTLGEALDITAVSLHAYASILDDYALMPCGASIGDGYGPMVVTRKPATFDDVKHVKIAVPGTMTTAFLALSLCIGTFDYEVVPFDEIIPAVCEGKFEAGLVIHEGQLSYAASGLFLAGDLGAWWKNETDLPLPLGANVVKKSLGQEVAGKLNRILKASIQYGLDHRKDALAHAGQYAIDVDGPMTDRFVGMYVNHYTLDFGDAGRKAVQLLLQKGHEAGLIAQPVNLEFIN